MGPLERLLRWLGIEPDEDEARTRQALETLNACNREQDPPQPPTP